MTGFYPESNRYTSGNQHGGVPPGVQHSLRATTAAAILTERQPRIDFPHTRFVDLPEHCFPDVGRAHRAAMALSSVPSIGSVWLRRRVEIPEYCRLRHDDLDISA